MRRLFVVSLLLPLMVRAARARQGPQSGEPEARADGDHLLRRRKLDAMLARLEFRPLKRFLEGFDSDVLDRFAAAAPPDNSELAAAWKAFNRLLMGGSPDTAGVVNAMQGAFPAPDNEGIPLQVELARLPPEEWYFVIELQKARQEIIAELGRGTWPKNVAAGNRERYLGEEAATKCFKRRQRLDAAIEKAGLLQRFPRWRPRPIQSNPGVGMTIPGIQRGEHNVSCYVYSEASTRVELVVDSWGDALMPAEPWWRASDPALHEALYGDGASEGCGERFQTVLADIYRRQDAERAR